MSTNKERIENLEASFGDLQTNFNQMEVGVGGKLLTNFPTQLSKTN